MAHSNLMAGEVREKNEVELTGKALADTRKVEVLLAGAACKAVYIYSNLLEFRLKEGTFDPSPRAPTGRTLVSAFAVPPPRGRRSNKR